MRLAGANAHLFALFQMRGKPFRFATALERLTLFGAVSSSARNALPEIHRQVTA
ncbi:MAG TPA: hypothetical protein VKH15_06690 [Candidatus Acidoferrum sp.]|nr:hypothetical protein [Candidatus Acidoferrum sp.]